MRGDYHIACQVDYGDSRYSADYVLRVKACTQLTRANIASAISANMAGNYLLTEDLTLSNWAAIGSVSSKFTGVFDGNGHTINLTMSVNNSNYNTGFIAYVDTAGSVRNLIVTGSIWSNVIATTGNDVQSGVGAITGYNNGTISNCVSRANVSGPQNVGGLVGQNHGIVEDSFATGTVTSLNLALNSGWYIAGGLIGVNTTDATVRRCYATGAVNIQHTGATIIIAGGLIGYDYGYFAGPVRHSNAVSDCYARGAVSGAATANSHYGGFVGYNLNCDYSACYATGVATNRFVGTNDGAANAYAACHSTVAQAGFSTALAAGVLPAGYTPLVWGSDAAAIINGGYPYLRQCGVGTVIP
jgi:hypothetical protein